MYTRRDTRLVSSNNSNSKIMVKTIARVTKIPRTTTITIITSILLLVFPNKNKSNKPT